MSNQTWKKTIFFYTRQVGSKTILPEKVRNFDKSEFATKQSKLYCKVYLTTSMSKTRVPHIYRGKNYVINLICSPFKSKNKKLIN